MFDMSKVPLRQDNRLDTKWAHPELLMGANWNVPNLMGTFFEMRDKTPESIADRESQRAFILDDYLEHESEKARHAESGSS